MTAARADRRLRWVKAFGDACGECEAPTRPVSWPSFVRAEAQRQGVRLGSGAAEALAERIGPHLMLLRNEIAKLALWAGPDGEIGAEHVAAGTALAAEAPIWDLGDAIAERRGADALRLLATLLAAGAAPPMLLGLPGEPLPAPASHQRGRVGGRSPRSCAASWPSRRAATVLRACALRWAQCTRPTWRSRARVVSAPSSRSSDW